MVLLYRRVSPVFLLTFVGFFFLLCFKGASASEKKVCPAIAPDLQSRWFDAAEKGKVRELKALLLLGVPIELENSRGSTALGLAVKAGKRGALRFLASKGANVCKASDEHEEPIFIAAFNNDVASLRLLLVNGAKVDNVNDFGLTPAFVAIKNESKSALRFLLKHGANANAKNKKRETMLLNAIAMGRCNIVNLLLKYGSDPCVPGPDGNPPIDVAKKIGNRKIMKILASRGAKEVGEV